MIPPQPPTRRLRAFLEARGAPIVLALVVLWSLLASGIFASRGLDAGRFWDERFSLENVRNALHTGSLRPANGWYPRLSYLPQAALLAGSHALHRWTGNEAFAVFGPEGDFSPSAYALARLPGVLAAAASLVLTFVIGRRLFSAPIGLLGAFLLAASPWHIRAAAEFKPDALLMLLTLLAFWWSLRAVGERSWSRWLLAGVGVGLATSAKYTGCLAATPLVVAVLADRRWRIDLPRLAGAGAASVAVFLAIHPDLGFYLGSFRSLQNLYAAKSSYGFWAMLYEQGRQFVSWPFHGRLVGALALLAVVLLPLVLWRRPERGERWRGRVMFWSFPIVFSLAYALASGLPKDNNYVPILPFTSLLAAWLVDRLVDRLGGRLTAWGRRVLYGAVAAALVVLAGGRANAYVLADVLPSTLDRAAGAIKVTSTFLDQRLVVHEPDLRPLRVVAYADGVVSAAAREVPALSEVPEEALDLADYEIFPERRLRGRSKEFYLRRLVRLEPDAFALFEPRALETFGAAQVLLIHPWHPVGRALPAARLRLRGDDRRRLEARLPAAPERGEVISLDVRVPKYSAAVTDLQVGGRALEIYWYLVSDTEVGGMTERFRVTRRRARIRATLDAPWDRPAPPTLTIWRWSATPPLPTPDAGAPPATR